MLAFGHFMGGMLIGYWLNKKNLYAALVCGCIALAPDLDLILERILPSALILHRNLQHTIIPALIFGGLLSYIFIKKYWTGIAAWMTHPILDLAMGGKVAILPYVFLETLGSGQYLMNKYPVTSLEASVIISTIFGCLIISYIVIDQWRTQKWIRQNKQA